MTKDTFEILTDIVAEWDKDMRALLAAKDAEIAALKKALGPTRGNRAAWQARAEKAEAERDALRRHRSEYDCRFTPGNVAETGGMHCPPGDPCQRCRLERAESRAARLAAVIPNLLAIIDAEVGECTCEQDWCSRCTAKALAEKGKS